MPIIFNPNLTIEENVEVAQKRLRSGEIDYTQYDNEVKDIYAFVFALRTTGNVVRDSKTTRRVRVVQKEFDPNYKTLQGSKTFGEFVKQNMDTANDVRKGHGGAAEEEFQKFVLDQQTLPTDIPTRYMPTCRKRVEKLQEDLKKKDAKSDEAVHIYSEIFRARRSVGAVHERDKKDRIDVFISGENYAKTQSLENSKTFRAFIEEKGDKFKKTIGSGHGGEAERMFRDYITEMEHLPQDVPQAYMPSAEKRTEAIQKKMKEATFNGLSTEKQQEYYFELLAARSCVGADRNKPATLNRYIDPKNNAAWVKYWSHSETLKNFLRENPITAKKAALSGHGGELEDKLKDYIVKMDKVPGDIPPKYMPNGKERIEALQDKIKANDFGSKQPEQKLDVYAQLMATRENVGALKGDKESLEKNLDPTRLNKSIKSWTENKTFKEFLEKNPEDARKAALKGHGGELGEKFKEYVKNLDHIPADIPTPFMPSAKERTEILQAKLKTTQDAKKRAQLYKELLATRASVEAVRNDKDSLEKQINAGKLNEAYGKLNKSISVSNFLIKTPADALYDSARKGHGGALEDAYTKYAAERTWTVGAVPSGVPDRFRPSPDAVMEKYKTELSASSRNKPDSWYNENSEKIMKRTAQVLYMTQVNAQNPSAKGRQAQMSHDLMQAGVQKIMNDGKFKNMFRDMGPKRAVQMMTGKNMMPLIEAYRNAPEPAPAVNPQPNRQQQQPVLQDPNHAPAQPQPGPQLHA